VLGYGIKDRLGQVIFGINTDLTKQAIEKVYKGQLIRYDIKFQANLGSGTYSVQTALTSTDSHLVNNYEWRDLIKIFTVVNLSKSRFEGSNWLNPCISIKEN
jgi:lipopolysaccharide transport system ATP-binding protein